LLLPIFKPTNFHIEQVWKCTGGRAQKLDLTLNVGDILLTSWKLCYSTVEPCHNDQGIYNRALCINIATASNPIFLPDGRNHKQRYGNRMHEENYLL
jgi:hypothetical protein